MGFDMPVLVPGLSSTGDDLAIFTPDELQAFVSSSRPGTLGGLDIFYSRRQTKSETFPAPKALDSLNTKSSEVALFVSDDGCTLYFRQATPPFGAYKILTATRPK